MCASAGGEWQCEAFGPMAFKGFPPPEVCGAYSYSYSYDPFMPCPDEDSAYLTCLNAAAQNGVDASAGLGWGCCDQDAVAGGSFPSTCAGMQTYSEFQDACGDPAPECAAEWSTYIECVYAEVLDVMNEDLTGAAPLNCDLSCTPPDPTPRPVAAPAPTPRPTLPAPTPRPTLAPTVAPVTGAITFSGLSLADAQANEAVLVDAIAASAGVEDKSRVSISIAATTRRRLSNGVIVTYSIATDTTADADALVTTLSALTTEDVNAALTTAAAEHGVAATFEAVTVTEVTVDEHEGGALGSDAAAARGPLLATAVLGAAAAAL